MARVLAVPADASLDAVLESEAVQREEILMESNVLDRLVAGPDLMMLASLIQCSICKREVVPPMYSCVNGHNVCMTCDNGKGKVNCRECQRLHPTCSPRRCTRFYCRKPNGIFRNLALENLLDKCCIKCAHEDFGCKFTGNGRELAVHYETCDYRMTPCFICKAIFKKTSAFLAHFQDCHSPPPLVLATDNMSINFHVSSISQEFLTSPQHYWFFREGFNFFVRIECANEAEKDGGEWAPWLIVSMLGSDTEIEVWQSQITLVNDQKELQFSYKCPMSSVRLSTRDAISSGHGVPLLPVVIRRFTDTHTIKIKVRVTRILEEQPHFLYRHRPSSNFSGTEDEEGIMEAEEDPNFAVLDGEDDDDDYLFEARSDDLLEGQELRRHNMSSDEVNDDSNPLFIDDERDDEGVINDEGEGDGVFNDEIFQVFEQAMSLDGDVYESPTSPTSSMDSDW